MDLRLAGRGSRRAPGSALAMIVLLALGIGGVAALFGPLYSLVLMPLPFPHSGRLVRIGGDAQKVDPYTNAFMNQRSLDSIFSTVMAYKTFQPTLTSGGPPAPIDGALVSPEFFATLGVQPRLGSGFSKSVTNAYGVVVSDQLWRTRLQRKRDLSVCSIVLDGNRSAVVGVMPPDFDFPSGVQVWEQAPPGTLAAQPVLVGRLRPGLSVGQAQAGLKTVASEGKSASGGPVLESLQNALLGDRRPLLWILCAVSVLFLALACAGVANLLLARGVRRRREMVVRLVLGAGRGRLIRQLLTETMLLAAAGGLLGLAFSALASRWLRLLLPEVERGSVSFPFATAALVLALALAVTILCGVAPAFHATGADLNSSLKAVNSGLSVSTPRRRIFTAHELFAGGQLILAMVLLISTGLLLRSMVARLRIPLGFQPQDVAVVKIPTLPADSAATKNYEQQHGRPNWRSKSDMEAMQQALGPADDAAAARHELFYADATHRLAELPGVVSLAVMDTPPFTKGAFDLASRRCLVDSRDSEIVARGVLFRYASTDAFRLLGVPLLAGRTFLPDDIPPRDTWKYRWYDYPLWSNVPEPQGVAIVNATLAHRIWPNRNPIGQMLYQPSPMRVIGVVGDVHESRNQLDVLPTVYRPFISSSPLVLSFSYVVKLRPGTPLAPFAAAVDRSLNSLLPGTTPPPPVLPLEEPVGNLRLALALLSCFSLMGTVVAGLGVYATATLMAAARTREMGIRLAIGAPAEQIGRLVLWRSVRLALLALPVGALGAWALGLNLSHWLFQVGATDPASYLISAAILLAIALAAGLWPALRAATLDPSDALRYDG
jgi:putative ABC transport system permease protein